MIYYLPTSIKSIYAFLFIFCVHRKVVLKVFLLAHENQLVRSCSEFKNSITYTSNFIGIWQEFRTCRNVWFNEGGVEETPPPPPLSKEMFLIYSSVWTSAPCTILWSWISNVNLGFFCGLHELSEYTYIGRTFCLFCENLMKLCRTNNTFENGDSWNFNQQNLKYLNKQFYFCVQKYN